MEQLIFECTTYSEEETTEKGYSFGKSLRAGDIVLLSGDLGAGKTHFTGGIAKALGYTDYVTSPTFTIVNEYEMKETSLIHFDIYRLSDIDDLYDIGFDDYLARNAVIVIEWADILPELEKLPGKIYRAVITRRDDIGPSVRNIRLTALN